MVMASYQMVHCIVKDRGSDFSCELTFVYSYNTNAERKEMLNQLRSLHNNINDPWLVMGDFNTILSVSDRMNGNLVNQTEVQDFQNCITDLGLGQLNKKGWQWSWCNKRDETDRIYNNIDWVFGNPQWFMLYSEIEAFYDCPGVSDHSPIILSTDKTKQRLPKPFRLFNVILQHGEFKEVVQ